MAVAVLQVTFSVLVALFVLRVAESMLLSRNPNSAVGQGLAFIIG